MNQFGILQDSLVRALGEMATAQKNQFAAFSQQMSLFANKSDENNKQLREELTTNLQLLSDRVVKTTTELTDSQKKQFDSFMLQYTQFSDSSNLSSNRLREELFLSIKALGESLIASQKDKLDNFALQLSKTAEQLDRSDKELRQEISANFKAVNESQTVTMGEMSNVQKGQMELFSNNLQALTESNQKRMDELRAAVETKLTQLQNDNTTKLDEMRKTVDEKLQGTLDKRLGESFKLVSERLDQVHKGLGEMQTLASGVGDLKKVLSNVKTRGTWGEIQLGNLLEQILTSDQYEMNVNTKMSENTRVEFAIKLPGKGEDQDKIVWLPIDSKFPKEAYERLTEAADRSDPIAVDLAAKELEACIKSQAKDIRDKYIDPPNTTDFAILFLPTEALFAEVLRRAGLVDQLQRDYRVSIAGPTTLAALLNSLQMGFRTLAIQKRSSEVWNVLGGVKAEFGKFNQVLEAIQKRLKQASKEVNRASIRTRAIDRKLRGVESLPTPAPSVPLLSSSIGGSITESAVAPVPKMLEDNEPN